MTLQEYQEQALRTLGDACIDNLIMGVIGETGEIIDYLKKVQYHGHKLDKDKLIDELGDLLWYTVSMATIRGYTLPDSIEQDFVYDVPVEPYLFEDWWRWLYESVVMMVRYTSLSGSKSGAANIETVIRRIQQGANLSKYTLDDVMQRNISKLKKRYPNGFEEQRSINRR